uniref:NADH-ubiquinone oxidoreductase 75 kDa subunit, mitochondrial n=1 Tax=Globodera pallida TaxID=36090 RepID=A0A183CCK8_GLOPA
MAETELADGVGLDGVGPKTELARRSWPASGTFSPSEKRRMFRTVGLKKNFAQRILRKNASTATVETASPKVEVTIDDKKVLVDPGMTILQPVASCAMPVMNGMRVKTNSSATKKAREGVMEFLLVNHPLDCPICDQGGECDLQDQSMAFGSDRSRHQNEYDGKRAVEDKDIGPLVKTIMTRCIHCTRCIRFANEVAGVPDLGSTGRGSDMQIGTYVEKLFASELSGNVIDLCPVGALTSKQYSFVARPWETRKTESIDVMDALGSNIVLSHRTGEILRIIPRMNDEVNEEWLSDKARFICDGLKRQRLLQPMLKNEFGVLSPCNWEEALFSAAQKLRQVHSDAIAGLAGALVDSDPIICSMTKLPTLRSVTIRKTYLYSDIEIGVIGANVDLTYDYTYLGSNSSVLDDLLSEVGKCKLSDDCSRDTEKLRSFSSAKQKPGVNGQAKVLNWLHEFAGHVAAFDIGYRPFNELSPEVKKSIKLLYLLGADDKPISRKDFHQDVFVIYQGHHGDNGAELADLILPGAAYTEKEAIWLSRYCPAWGCSSRLEDHSGIERSGWSQIAVRFNYGYKTSAVRGRASFEPLRRRSLEPRQCTLADYWLTNSIARASPTMAQCVKASRQYTVQPHTDPLRLTNPHA